MKQKLALSWSANTTWLRRLRVMTVKEMLQLFRDAALMLFIVYAFTLDIYIAGTGISFDLKNAVVVVRDSDHSAASREITYRLRPPYFHMKKEILDDRAGLRLLDKGEAMAVLDIPSQFQKTLLKGEPAALQFQVDTSNSVLGQLAASYAAQIVGQLGFDAAMERMGLTPESLEQVPLIEREHRVWYNPNQDDAWFMSVLELLIIITIFAIFLPAAAMVREKERGTIEQLLVSPLTPFQIMAAKVLAMTLVILAGTAVSLLVVLVPIIGLPVKGSIPLFFAFTALYAFTMAGFGLFVASVTRNLAQAGMLSILILAPTLLLSGAWTPPEAMPVWLQYLMTICPMYHFLDIAYGILLKGAGMDILWDSVLVMTLLGVAVFSFGMWRFRRQFQ